jgi:hypothetical protein
MILIIETMSERMASFYYYCGSKENAIRTIKIYDYVMIGKRKKPIMEFGDECPIFNKILEYVKNKKI